MDDRAHLAAKPINPQRVFWELSPQLPDAAILCADSGSAANWFARDLKLRRGMKATLSGSLATMGCGVPYAIGAKFAHPDRPVIALVGDGAMQMNGMDELLTIKKYWKEWKDPRLVILVLHNNDLNQVTWEMRAMAGDTRYVASQELPDFEYARYAELVGLRGIKVDRPEDIWPRALGRGARVGRARPGRGGRRSRRPAAPAAHHARADAELRPEPAEAREGRRFSHKLERAPVELRENWHDRHGRILRAIPRCTDNRCVTSPGLTLAISFSAVVPPTVSATASSGGHFAIASSSVVTT